MKSKQLVLLILLAAILGGAVWYLKKQNKETWSDTSAGSGGKVVEFPINDVARLTIQSSAGTVNLARKDDAWIVQERADYPANFERVGNLLRKLWELKSVQVIQAGPSQFVRFDLVEPAAEGGGAGTRVEFKDKDGKALGGLLVGKKFMKKSDIGVAEAGDFPAGRYVMAPGGSKVLLISETLDDIEPKPESWLLRDFIKIENPSSVTLAGTTDAQKWKLTRENTTAEWKLDGAKPDEKADAAKISQVAGAFGFPSFVDVLNPDAKPADTGLDKPAVITFTTFDGFTYVLKVGKETDGNLPVTLEVSAQLAKERTPGKDEKPEDKTKLDEEFKTNLKKLEDKLAAEKKFEGRAYLIAKSTVDQMVKDRAALLEEKKPEPAPGSTPQPPGAPPFPGAMAPTPPHPPISATSPPVSVPAAPGTPAPKPPPPDRKPITVTTPPVSIPPATKPPAPNPPQPERKPITVTTPPLSIPPATQPPKPDATPPSPDKPKTPETPKAPSPPAAPKEPSDAKPPTAPPPAKESENPAGNK